MPQKLEEVLQTARKMESDGIDFYTEAAGNARNEMARRFFDSLAKDERRHLEFVENIGKGMGVSVDSMVSPVERIKTVFSEVTPQEASELAAAAEEKDAINVALEMEKKSYNLYSEAAEAADDSGVKKLLERLQIEENQHYEMLKNTDEYINENERWFLNTEAALLTGDMSSLG